MPLPSFRRENVAPPLEVKRPELRPRSGKRGYDYRWAVFAARFRRQHPFCIECERAGRVTPTDVADHVVPILDGGPRLDRDNVQPLCNDHHNGWKRELEDAARELGDITILVLWCSDPSTRPDHLKPR